MYHMVTMCWYEMEQKIQIRMLYLHLLIKKIIIYIHLNRPKYLHDLILPWDKKHKRSSETVQYALFRVDGNKLYTLGL